jgi:adenylate cyclase
VTDTELKKRLAAILAADAAGYSRLMAEDERATVAALDAARGVFRAHVESNQGRIVDTAGDSVLAVFDSAAGAVSAAIEVQKVLDAGMRFRIGVHLGDVIEKPDGTVYGDGVNIAARLQALAGEGGIVVSDAIHSAVRGKVSASFTDRGEQQVKNIPHPVRAFAVAGSAPAARSNLGIDLSLPDKPSIAVLPFANMSGDPEQEYFTDGVTEDIITELSRFHSLFVIARNSTFTYKGKAVDVRQVSKELGVRYVLEGGIRKAGNRVRVTAQLIDALSGSHLWAERYDRSLEDIFAVQEEVTRSIIFAIAPHIEAAEHAKAQRMRPENLTAYEIAVRARSELFLTFYNQDRAARDRAIDESRRALAIDPRSTIALSNLGFAMFQQVFYRTCVDVEKAWNEGIENATRLIETDRGYSDGYRHRGMLYGIAPAGDRWEEAFADCRHAHELNPNDATNLQALGWIQVTSGDAAAGLKHILAGIRANPRDPWAANGFAQVALAHFALRSYGEGLEWAARAAIETPKLPGAHLLVAMCQVGLGEIGKAKAALETARKLAPEYVESRLAGNSIFRRPAERARSILFARIAAGLEDPSAGQALP